MEPYKEQYGYLFRLLFSQSAKVNGLRLRILGDRLSECIGIEMTITSLQISSRFRLGLSGRKLDVKSQQNP